ncbi:MAG TPA: SdrD B-like domain-containing protein [Opitutaceae bacterium]
MLPHLRCLRSVSSALFGVFAAFATANVALAIPHAQPPVVTITSPAANASLSGSECGGPATVDIEFNATSPAGIGSFTATLDGNPLAVTTSNLGATPATGSASVSFSTSGSHTLVVVASDTNAVASAPASVSFTVTITSPPPPIASVGSPANGATYSYNAGYNQSNTGVTVPVSVSATSGIGNISSLSAVLVNPDASQTPITLTTSGVGSASASGVGSVNLTVGGTYSVLVTAVDDCNTVSASSSFTLNVVTIYPPPTVTVTLPNGSVYTYVDCAGSASVLLNFSGAANGGLNVAALTATLDGSPLAITPLGIGTPNASASTTISVTGGNHVVSVSVQDSNGGTNSTNTNFTVNETTAPAPSFTNLTPSGSPTISYYSNQTEPTVNIGANVTAGYGNIVSLSAQLMGPSSTSSLPLSTTGVGTSGNVTASATLANLPSGQYTVQFTATDGCNTSIANVTFSITEITYTPPTGSITLPNGSTYTRNDCDQPLTIPVNFTGTSAEFNIASITATLDGNPIGISTANLQSPNATGTASLSVTAGGIHTIVLTVNDTDNGSFSTSTTFTVTLTTSPNPTVTISSPSNNASYSSTNNAPVSIPVSVSATAGYGNITQLSAVLITPSATQQPITLSTTGVGTSATASGTASLSLTAGGTYTIQVTATDACANVSTSSSVFTITSVTNYPPPTTCVTLPNGSCYTGNDCSGPVKVAVQVAGNSTALPIASLTATLDHVTPISLNLSGIGTEHATGTGTVSVSTAGTHTITVTAVDSKGGTSTSSGNFTVTITTIAAPAVSISSPVGGTDYTYSGSALNIPLHTSATAAFGTISSLSATLDGSAIQLSVSGLNTATASGSATLNPTSCQQHVVVVTAVDNCGNRSTSTVSFVVRPPTIVCVKGCVYFDVDGSGCQRQGEPGLCGATVNLYDCNLHCIGTTQTCSDGSYSFNEPCGSYLVSVCHPNGFCSSQGGQNSQCQINVGSTCCTVPPVGTCLNWHQICGQRVCASTASSWCGNFSRSSCNRNYGNDLCESRLQSYCCTVGNYGVGCFHGLTCNQATQILGYGGYNSCSALQRELLGCEINTVNGSCIGGNQQLTNCFIYWGEYVLQNANSFGNQYCQFAATWCAAYNQTQGGGCIYGPVP